MQNSIEFTFKKPDFMKNSPFLLFTAVLFFFSFTSKAQDATTETPKVEAANTITKGTQVIGGGASGAVEINKNYTNTDFQLNPFYGYFVSNRMQINAGISLISYRYNQAGNINGENAFGFSPGMSYYFFVKNRSAVSGSCSLGILREENISGNKVEASGNYLSAQIGINYNYFISSYLALNCSFTYSRYYGVFDANSISVIPYGVGQLSVGASWFLTRACR